jgi:hypothetical protein
LIFLDLSSLFDVLSIILKEKIEIISLEMKKKGYFLSKMNYIDNQILIFSENYSILMNSF